jgi:integrase
MKCNCPLWVYGWRRGEKVPRTSLATSDLAEAARQLALMQDPATPSLKTIAEAVDAYQKHILGLTAGTQRRYAIPLRLLTDYSTRKKLKYVTELTVEALDDFRSARTLAPTTSAKELIILRMFLAFALERKWIAENPAKRIKPPRNIKPTEIVPYTRQEITRILAACEGVGNSAYERLRARAMVLLMLLTGLRISDATMLRRDRIHHGRLFLHTLKTGERVFQPVEKLLEDALNALPPPRKAGPEPPYYFWNERGSRRGVVNSMERLLRAVFKKAGVQHAHAHKFRHTLATDMLAKGKTTADVAGILGISEAVVIRHYARWSEARQERIDQAVRERYADLFGSQPVTPQKTVH